MRVNNNIKEINVIIINLFCIKHPFSEMLLCHLNSQQNGWGFCQESNMHILRVLFILSLFKGAIEKNK
jgi:hypothetical protein